MTYVPTPIDTSAVALPDEVRKLTERLAENAHDIWAQRRMADGWRYGPRRDDAHKEHPDLVPYEQLPEGEKQYDREVAQGALKLILALGYRFEAPADAAAPARDEEPLPAPAATSRDVDDMHDTEADLAAYPALSEALRVCRARLLRPYEEADRRALAQQRVHRGLTLVCALTGTLAVVFAVAQLGGVRTWPAGPGVEGTAARLLSLLHGDWTGWAELVAMGLACVAIAFGLLARLQRRWLLERHRAERLRLLKWRFLTRPALWSGRPEDVRHHEAWLRGEVKPIEDLEREKVEAWSETDVAPDVPVPPAGARFDLAALRQLVEYYRRRRLDVQLAYLDRQAGRQERRDHRTRMLPHVLFAGSVVVVAAHYAYEWLRPLPAEEGLGAFNVLLILFAVTLPVLAAGVRTYRIAHEYGRNVVRFRAKAVALRDLTARLESERQPDAVLRNLWSCEQVIESDHREWLRLMIEAEWFG